MHQQKPPSQPGKTGQTDVETGKPQDMRDRRMPGEGGVQHSQQGERTGQQGAAPSTTQHDPSQHRQEQVDRAKQQGGHDAKSPGGKSQHQQETRDPSKQHGGHESKQQGSNDASTHGGKKPGQQSQSNTSDKVHGEGNYAASRDYNERTKQFVESGRVEQAARDAAPRNEDEARELSAAEQEGLSHAKEEDPAVNPDKSHKPGRGPDE
jgi:hypothetical protein